MQGSLVLMGFYDKIETRAMLATGCPAPVAAHGIAAKNVKKVTGIANIENFALVVRLGKQCERLQVYMTSLKNAS